MSSEPTVFIVDDDEGQRSALERLMRSVGLRAETYDSAQAFLEAYDQTRVGCLVLDIRMPGMSGLALLEKLSEEECPPPVIVITGHPDVATAVQSLNLGAVDFLQKPHYSPQHLLDLIHESLARDERRRHDALLRRKLRERVERLSPRERQVMELVVAGRANKEVAAELEVSEKTVEVHRSRVMKKLEADSVAHLVRIALEADAVPHLKKLNDLFPDESKSSPARDEEMSPQR